MMWYVVLHPKKSSTRTFFRDPDRASALREEYKRTYAECDQVLQVRDIRFI